MGIKVISTNMNFADYITAHLDKPFAWGSNDCVLFAVGWLTLQTGEDWLVDVPKWTNEKAARKAVQSVGGLTAAFDHSLTRIPATMARDGDLALVGGTTFLFCGPHIVGPGPNGLIFHDRANACLAWSL